MSRGYYKRRSVFRPDAGRAFLRFLIGLVLLAALCALFYIFVLQGKINIQLPQPQTQTGDAVQTADVTPLPRESVLPVVTEAPVVVTAEPTAVPTIESTAEPTEAPTPEPTATPVPAEELRAICPLPANLPDLPSSTLKIGLKEMRIMNSADQNVFIVRGYAYLEGADASASKGYIVLMDVNGQKVGAYPVQACPEDADLTFDTSAGSNLDHAFFKLKADLSGLPDGIYLAAMAVENGGKIQWNYMDDALFHFFVTEGQAVLSE